MDRNNRNTILAAVVFGGVAGACSLGFLLFWSAAFFALPAVVWLFMVGSSAVAATAGGGAGWAVVVRLAGLPAERYGALAGLLGVAFGYVIHGGILILTLAAWWALGPPKEGVKGQSSLVFYGIVLGYPWSTALFVPAALATGAALGWAVRERT